VGGASKRGIVQLVGVEGEASGHLNAGAEALGVTEDEETCGVNLCLNKGRAVQIGLCTDFKANVACGRLRIVNGLGTSLNIAADAVVVRSSEGVHVSKAVDGDSVFGCTVAEGGSVTRNAALGDVVSAFSTKKETVTTEDSVSSERRALEDINEGTGVETRLLVDGAQDGVFSAFVGVESRVDFELQALGDLVLDLDGGPEDVARRPSFSDSEAILGVDVFSLQVTVDLVALGIGGSSDLEGDIGRGLSLDFETSAMDVEVLVQEII